MGDKGQTMDGPLRKVLGDILVEPHPSLVVSETRQKSGPLSQLSHILAENVLPRTRQIRAFG